MVSRISTLLVPRFPISLYGAEWNEWSYQDDRELAAAIEFMDDAGPAYDAVDAEGYPVRLIVWNVEVLVCHRVMTTTSGGKPDLRIFDGCTAEGLATKVEVHDDKPVRALVIAGRKVRALPERWSDTINVMLRGDQTAADSSSQFHASWMRARTRRRWP
jgi:hypothetical protein